MESDREEWSQDWVVCNHVWLSTDVRVSSVATEKLVDEMRQGRYRQIV